ncbi:cytochrome C oxidase subunit IV family protein [Mycolicibacterium sp.]|uniref:cytochrome C oxidase subunit IV family protein n=1 Tax=Mycolicibacterium sp. TaxID=2320850 RepID=UPI0037C71F7B
MTTRTRTEGRLITYVWLALSVLTVASWWVGPVRGDATPQPSVPITMIVLVLGLVKCRLVFRYFMEIRSAPHWLRWVTDGWLLVLWGAVLAIYLW